MPGMKDKHKMNENLIMNEIGKHEETTSIKRMEITRGLVSENSWNDKIQKAWDDQKRNWKKRKEGEDEEENEEHFGMIYSPASDTEEGKEQGVKECRRLAN